MRKHKIRDLLNALPEEIDLHVLAETLGYLERLEASRAASRDGDAIDAELPGRLITVFPLPNPSGGTTETRGCVRRVDGAALATAGSW